MVTKKTPVRIKISHKHTFGMYGYKTSDNAEKRRRSLARVARIKGSGMTIRRLNALAVLNKNRSPVLSRKFRSDMKWIQKNFSTKKQSKTRKRRKSPSTRKRRYSTTRKNKQK